MPRRSKSTIAVWNRHLKAPKRHLSYPHIPFIIGIYHTFQTHDAIA